MVSSRLAARRVRRTLLICTGLVLVAGCARQEKAASESIAEIQKREGIPVRVEVIQPATLEKIERQSGTVEGIQQGELSSNVPGTLSNIAVKAGSEVTRGTTLASVDPDMASPYTMAKTQYDNAEKALERVRTLAREGAVPPEAVEQVEAGYTVARAQLDAAVKTVNVIAPFDGTVIEVFEKVNTKVGPGQTLFKVARIDRARIELKVNETVINHFSPSQKAFVVLDNDTIGGEVQDVALGARSATHAFPVSVVFPNSRRLLRPGMFLTVHVITARKTGVLVLSPETVLRENGTTYVYVVENNIAYKREITLGMRGDGGYEITSGLAAGDQVVIQGTSMLANETSVKIVD